MAMEQANVGHAQSYGEDAWKSRASELFRELFQKDCEVFLPLMARRQTHSR